MKLNKLITTLTASALISVVGISLSSCNDDTTSEWKISADDWSSMNANVKSSIYEDPNDNSKFIISVTLNDDAFTKNAINTKNFYLLDINNLRSSYDSSSEYVTADLLNEHKIDYDSVSLSADSKTFYLTTSTYPRNDVGVLFNENCTDDQTYYLANVTITPQLGGYSSPAYDEYYTAQSEVDFSKECQTVTSAMSSIAAIYVGVQTDNAVAITSGICALASQYAGTKFPSSVSIKDVLKQVTSLQTSMNELSDKIDRNHSQLMDETVRTESLVYKQLLATTETNIKDFVTSYIQPYNDLSGNLTQYTEHQFEYYVKSTQEISLNLYKNSSGELAPIYLYDTINQVYDTYTLTVSDFSNSNKFISEHDGNATTGFIDAFHEDIINAIIKKNSNLPEGLDEEKVALYIESIINEKFIKGYYENVGKSEEVLKRINLLRNMSQQIYGKYNYSFASTMYDRIKYMFNFAGEAKDSFETIAAYYMNLIDRMVAEVAMASKYTGCDYTVVLEDAQKARDAFKNLNTTVQNTDNAYAYTLNKTLTGSLYQSAISDTRSKNNFTMTHSYYKYTDFYGNPGEGLSNYKFEEISVSEFDAIKKVTSADLKTIAYRMNSLMELGYVDASTDFIHYLKNNGVIDEDALNTYMLFNEDDTTATAYRIVSDITVQNLKNNDGGLKLTAVDYGRNNDEFTIGQNVDYLSKNDDSFWSGKKYMGEWVDGLTGQTVTNEVLDAYARYDDTSGYWFQDKRWAFVLNTPSTQFFVISYQ